MSIQWLPKFDDCVASACSDVGYYVLLRYLDLKRCLGLRGGSSIVIPTIIECSARLYVREWWG